KQPDKLNDLLESNKTLCIIYMLKEQRIRPMIPRGDIVSVGSSKAGVHRYQAQISLALSCT
ncbi:hypothetical protein EAY74_20700, partial [Vibrio anguillarum]|nr:hypothetical protein [Vibrio anguillarum]